MWDLRIGEEHKFGMEMEPLYIASLFNAVDQLEYADHEEKLSSKRSSHSSREAKRLA